MQFLSCPLNTIKLKNVAPHSKILATSGDDIFIIKILMLRSILILLFVNLFTFIGLFDSIDIIYMI